MRVWQGLESIVEPFEESTVAIGVFDGIHRGHQALVEAAVSDAHRRRRRAVVFTFDRHPAELIAPEKAPPYLTNPDQRIDLLAALGIDDLVIARFDERLRCLSPESFLHFVVVGILGARSVFVGFDFRFGHDQSGDVAYLRDAQDRLGFAVHVLDPVVVDGERVSSSRIRELLQEGELQRALDLLGHPYVLIGCVVEGRKLGRKLGFPTANIELTDRRVVPADGIYATWAWRRGERLPGACSIGVRPTVGGINRTIEVYILDFDGDLYNEELSLEFVKRLREERRFDTLEALTEQIALDVEDVRRVMAAGR